MFPVGRKQSEGNRWWGFPLGVHGDLLVSLLVVCCFGWLAGWFGLFCLILVLALVLVWFVAVVLACRVLVCLAFSLPCLALSCLVLAYVFCIL